MHLLEFAADGVVALFIILWILYLAIGLKYNKWWNKEDL